MSTSATPTSSSLPAGPLQVPLTNPASRPESAPHAGALPVRLGEHAVYLLPSRCAFLPHSRALLVADIHLGKPAAFGAHGIPVPVATAAADLARLGAAIDSVSPQRLYILGDLLHAKTGRDAATFDAVRAWRCERGSLPITLVRGNHDDKAGDPPREWGIDCVDEPFALGSISLCHYPPERPDAACAGLRDIAGVFTIAGHVHPVIGMEGPARMNERVPCFVAGAWGLVLPAFGSFTGGKRVKPAAGERYFAVGDGCVIEVPMYVEQPTWPGRKRRW